MSKIVCKGCVIFRHLGNTEGLEYDLSVFLRSITHQRVYRWGIVAVFFGAAALFLLISVLGGKYVQRFYPSVQINNHKIDVEIAGTAEARERGLGGHAPLSDSEGMLFVFDNPIVQTFWMKGMTFPIDIVWIGADSRGEAFIAGIENNVDPQIGATVRDMELYQSPVPVQYVLEVRGGLMDKWEVRIGDPVTLRLVGGK